MKCGKASTRLAGFDFSGDAIILGARDYVALHEIFRVGIWAMVDDAAGSFIVNSGKALEIVG